MSRVVLFGGHGGTVKRRGLRVGLVVYHGTGKAGAGRSGL